MAKAQWHFETDLELKAQWKAFFKLLPRKEETRVLNMLVRNFLAEMVKQNVAPEGEADDTPKMEVDLLGNREGTDESVRTEVVADNRPSDETGNSDSLDMGKAD